MSRRTEPDPLYFKTDHAQGTVTVFDPRGVTVARNMGLRSDTARSITLTESNLIELLSELQVGLPVLADVAGL